MTDLPDYPTESAAEPDKALAPIAAEQQVLANLNRQFADATAREQANRVARSKVAYAAIVTKDADAQQQLSDLDNEAVRISNEREAFGAAITEGGQRLDAARRAADRKAQHQRARNVQEQLVEFSELGPELDKLIGTFAASYQELERQAREMRLNGAPVPTAMLIAASARRALETSLATCGGIVDRVPPAQRKTFGTLVAQISLGLSNWVDRELVDSTEGASKAGEGDCDQRAA